MTRRTTVRTSTRQSASGLPRDVDTTGEAPTAYYGAINLSPRH